MIFLIGVVFVPAILLTLSDTSYSLSKFLPTTTVFDSNMNTTLSQCLPSGPVDLNWYPPAQTMINNLSTVLNGSGIYDFVFNSSSTPSDLPYSTYNWCNMPHVRAKEYQVPDKDYQLEYVEVVRYHSHDTFLSRTDQFLQIHRHHKRTPYAANLFPNEQQSWYCSDSSLYYYATTPSPSESNNAEAAQINWAITPPPLHPFSGNSAILNSTCQFPQITGGGLLDSLQHGSDLGSVYIDLLHFLPSTYDADRITFRVTNNVITSQVASQVAAGLYPSLAGDSLPVIVQPSTIDSLEPTYSCPAATKLYASYGVGSSNPAWLAHLNASSTKSLFATLDTISGVNASDPAWHTWVDHYFDNLSAKLCHAKQLDCDPTNSSLCITTDLADDIFRRGLYEYSYIYRDNSSSLPASTASFGIFLAELAQNLRQVLGSQHSDTAKSTTMNNILWRHNIAHDGSISRLLSILQLDVMVWPGMGSEVVFELWKSQSSGCWFVRILWKGQVLKSSNPTLSGAGGMIPVQQFLGYVDGLVGEKAVKVPSLCSTK